MGSMDLAAVALLEVDDIEVVGTGDLGTISTGPGVVTVPGIPADGAPSGSARHCHPFCGPVHTHAVGARPDAG